MANNNDEQHPLFPSGEWEGFYTYAMGASARRHTMSLTLTFQNGAITGQGVDDVSAFRYQGDYDIAAMRCTMTKFYTARLHTVLYEGHVDENGIWGSWNIERRISGGFHIWPVKNGQDDETSESTSADKDVAIKEFELLPV
jgi:hypothetical protein